LFIADSFSNRIPVVGEFIVQVIMGLTIAFQTSWRMSLMMFATAPFMVLGILASTSISNIVTKKSSEASGNSITTATEVFSSMR
jgi:ABC-type multidrug transport system fused ATPase/permease subunit